MAENPPSRRSFLIKCAIGGTAAAALGGFGFVLRKDQTWVDSEPYQRDGGSSADSVVIVYSRSGNTLLASRELARQLDADLFRIQAPAYPQTFPGQMRASSDASEKLRISEISHAEINFENYQRVLLCSPTWWYRPAVPLWSFVDNHDFANRDVFLLLTGNSGYRAENIDEFGELVSARGGRLTGHHFIERGRVFWQLSDDELRERAKDLASTLAARFG